MPKTPYFGLSAGRNIVTSSERNFIFCEEVRGQVFQPPNRATVVVIQNMKCGEQITCTCTVVLKQSMAQFTFSLSIKFCSILSVRPIHVLRHVYMAVIRKKARGRFLAADWQ